MKKFYITFFCIIVLSLSFFAQIPNNGFETWTTIGSHVNPDNWGCLNDVTAANSTTIFTCTKGTPGNPGTAYLKLVSRSISGLGIVPGIAVCGTLDVASRKPKSGFPYAIRSQKLTGKWQHMSDSDQGYIDVLLSAWNNTLNKRDTVAYAHRILGAMAMSWANFSINLNYISGATPDSAIIFFSASPTVAVSGDYLYIDNLAFTGTVIGTEINDTKISNNKINIFPNPCQNILNISLFAESPEYVIVQIYDITNRLIKTENLGAASGIIEKSISTNTLSKGLYLMNILSGNRKTTKPFIVE